MTERKVKESKISRKIIKFFATTAVEGSIALTQSHDATRYLCVINAGLANGFAKEELFEVFAPYGYVEEIIMLPSRSCSFVRFGQTNAALKCMQMINGSFCLQNGSQPLYLCYLNDFGNVTREKQELWNACPPGLTVIENFISEAEEKELLRVVQMDVDATHLKHRAVKHFGYIFQYGVNCVDKENPRCGAIPNEIQPLIKRISSVDASLHEPDQLTVNMYPPGGGIPPHIDTHNSFEDGLISISLGSGVTMDFKHPDGKQIPVFLSQRSCLVMTGESRYLWSHGITPRKSDIVNSPSGGLTVVTRGTRTSLTFRKTRTHDCDCPYENYCDAPSRKLDTVCEKTADRLERMHVFDVYEEIAGHFSDTRHRPWPNVLKFIKSITLGSILIDIGCGNGKYLNQSELLFNIGCDRSWKLLQICQTLKGQPLVNADCRCSPFRDGIADAVICIAVIHHLATEERRLKAIEDINRVLRKGGRALIYVWAKEQQIGSDKSTYLLQRKSSLVRMMTNDEMQPADGSAPKVINLPIHSNRTDFKHADVFVPWNHKSKSSHTPKQLGSSLYLRYYHVFEKGELEALCSQLSSIRILNSFYDQGNWCVELEKV